MKTIQKLAAPFFVGFGAAFILGVAATHLLVGLNAVQKADAGKVLWEAWAHWPFLTGALCAGLAWWDERGGK